MGAAKLSMQISHMAAGSYMVGQGLYRKTKEVQCVREFVFLSNSEEWADLGNGVAMLYKRLQ